MAYSIDPTGDYRLVEEGNLNLFDNNTFDLVQSIFTFDNIPTEELKVKLFIEFYRILRKGGSMINLVSSPDIYTHDWVSFNTTCFHDNFTAKCGDKVKTIMLDIEDQRPVEDILWPEIDYKRIYKIAGFELIKTYRPLGHENEPIKWVNETRIAPWVIYVLVRDILK